MIVAIDGPAGSGKSTAARGLARRLGFAHLDTGAMYRAATLHALRSGVDLADAEATAAAVRRARIEVAGDRILLDGEDVSRAIREPTVTAHVYRIAENAAVRADLVERQRALARGRDAVVEGRDIGTVVFPAAELKLYVDASPEERARRRVEELRARGQEADPAAVLRDLVQRDRRDSERAVAPLRRAADAVLIDTTSRDPAAVIDAVERLARERLRLGPGPATRGA